MASVVKDVRVAVEPGAVWRVLRDPAGLLRVFPKMLTRVEMEGDVRTLTFANGMTVREKIVTIDNDAMRIVYSASGGRTTHHNASFQVFADEKGSRIVWITDLLPNEMAEPIASLMSAGLADMKAALEATP